MPMDFWPQFFSGLNPAAEQQQAHNLQQTEQMTSTPQQQQQSQSLQQQSNANEAAGTDEQEQGLAYVPDTYLYSYPSWYTASAPPPQPIVDLDIGGWGPRFDFGFYGGRWPRGYYGGRYGERWPRDRDGWRWGRGDWRERR